MRILHVVPTYLPATRYGGPIHSVHGTCKALAAAGHEVEVYTTSVDGPDDSDVPHGVPVELDAVRVTYFRSRVGRRLYYAPALAAALSTRAADFDLVHLHSVFLWPTSRVARWAAAHHVPYLVSPRGMLVRELIEARSTLAKVAWLELFESTTLAQASAVHFTSTRELLDARSLPLALPAPFILPNGVDLPELPPPRLAGDDSSRHILYLGRLSWKKNLERCVEALVGTDMQLLLCGPDEEGLTPRLRTHAERLGVGAQLGFRPPVAPEGKWAMLNAADVVVLPSYNENFGNVVPEAMACGRPVVVSSGVGASDIVEAAGAGRACEPDADSLRGALLSLWTDEGARRDAGERGRRYVVAELGWPRIATQLSAHYERIIERGA